MPVDNAFIDDLGQQDVFDNTVPLPVTLWIDDGGFFLGIGGPTNILFTSASLKGTGPLLASTKQKSKIFSRFSALGNLSADTYFAGLLANPLWAPSPRISTPLLSVNVASILFSRTLDNGMRSLADEADKIIICSAHPINYAQAVSFSLGEKDFGTPGGAFGAIVAGSNGRKVASTAITDGALTVAGVGTHWAAVDSAASRLLATGPFDVAKPTFAGVPFSLPSFELTLTGSN